MALDLIQSAFSAGLHTGNATATGNSVISQDDVQQITRGQLALGMTSGGHSARADGFMGPPSRNSRALFGRFEQTGSDTTAIAVAQQEDDEADVTDTSSVLHSHSVLMPTPTCKLTTLTSEHHSLFVRIPLSVMQSGTHCFGGFLWRNDLAVVYHDMVLLFHFLAEKMHEEANRSHNQLQLKRQELRNPPPPPPPREDGKLDPPPPPPPKEYTQPVITMELVVNGRSVRVHALDEYDPVLVAHAARTNPGSVLEMRLGLHYEEPREVDLEALASDQPYGSRGRHAPVPDVPPMPPQYDQAVLDQRERIPGCHRVAWILFEYFKEREGDTTGSNGVFFGGRGRGRGGGGRGGGGGGGGGRGGSGRGASGAPQIPTTEDGQHAFVPGLFNGANVNLAIQYVSGNPRPHVAAVMEQAFPTYADLRRKLRKYALTATNYREYHSMGDRGGGGGGDSDSYLDVRSIDRDRHPLALTKVFAFESMVTQNKDVVKIQSDAKYYYDMRCQRETGVNRGPLTPSVPGCIWYIRPSEVSPRTMYKFQFPSVEPEVSTSDSQYLVMFTEAMKRPFADRVRDACNSVCDVERANRQRALFDQSLSLSTKRGTMPDSARNLSRNLERMNMEAAAPAPVVMNKKQLGAPAPADLEAAVATDHDRLFVRRRVALYGEFVHSCSGSAESNPDHVEHCESMVDDVKRALEEHGGGLSDPADMPDYHALVELAQTDPEAARRDPRVRLAQIGKLVEEALSMHCLRTIKDQQMRVLVDQSELTVRRLFVKNRRTRASIKHRADQLRRDLTQDETERHADAVAALEEERALENLERVSSDEIAQSTPAAVPRLRSRVQLDAEHKQKLEAVEEQVEEFFSRQMVQFKYQAMDELLLLFRNGRYPKALESVLEWIRVQEEEFEQTQAEEQGRAMRSSRGAVSRPLDPSASDASASSFQQQQPRPRQQPPPRPPVAAAAAVGVRKNAFCYPRQQRFYNLSFFGETRARALLTCELLWRFCYNHQLFMLMWIGTKDRMHWAPMHMNYLLLGDAATGKTFCLHMLESLCVKDGTDWVGRQSRLASACEDDPTRPRRQGVCWLHDEGNLNLLSMQRDTGRSRYSANMAVSTGERAHYDALPTEECQLLLSAMTTGAATTRRLGYDQKLLVWKQVLTVVIVQLCHIFNFNGNKSMVYRPLGSRCHVIELRHNERAGGVDTFEKLSDAELGPRFHDQTNKERVVWQRDDAFHYIFATLLNTGIFDKVNLEVADAVFRQTITLCRETGMAVEDNPRILTQYYRMCRLYAIDNVIHALFDMDESPLQGYRGRLSLHQLLVGEIGLVCTKEIAMHSLTALANMLEDPTRFQVENAIYELMCCGRSDEEDYQVLSFGPCAKCEDKILHERGMASGYKPCPDCNVNVYCAYVMLPSAAAAMSAVGSGGIMREGGMAYQPGAAATAAAARAGDGDAAPAPSSRSRFDPTATQGTPIDILVKQVSLMLRNVASVSAIRETIVDMVLQRESASRRDEIKEKEKAAAAAAAVASPLRPARKRSRDTLEAAAAAAAAASDPTQPGTEPSSSQTQGGMPSTVRVRVSVEDSLRMVAEEAEGMNPDLDDSVPWDASPETLKASVEAALRAEEAEAKQHGTAEERERKAMMRSFALDAERRRVRKWSIRNANKEQYPVLSVWRVGQLLAIAMAKSAHDASKPRRLLWAMKEVLQHKHVLGGTFVTNYVHRNLPYIYRTAKVRRDPKKKLVVRSTAYASDFQRHILADREDEAKGALQDVFASAPVQVIEEDVDVRATEHHRKEIGFTKEMVAAARVLTAQQQRSIRGRAVNQYFRLRRETERSVSPPPPGPSEKDTATTRRHAALIRRLRRERQLDETFRARGQEFMYRYPDGAIGQDAALSMDKHRQELAMREGGYLLNQELSDEEAEDEEGEFEHEEEDEDDDAAVLAAAAARAPTQPQTLSQPPLSVDKPVPAFRTEGSPDESDDEDDVPAPAPAPAPVSTRSFNPSMNLDLDMDMEIERQREEEEEEHLCKQQQQQQQQSQPQTQPLPAAVASTGDETNFSHFFDTD